MAIFAAALAAVFACQPKENIEFALDNDSLVVGADGGSTTIEVSSSGPWIASVNVPWITVSPANGNGSHECQIIVDSALVLKSGNPEDNVRRGTVTIVSDDWDSRDISVEQYNYGYTIARSMMARAIVGAGLCPSISVFHSNRIKVFRHFEL